MSSPLSAASSPRKLQSHAYPEQCVGPRRTLSPIAAPPYIPPASMGLLMRHFSVISLILFVFSGSALAGSPADPFTVTGIHVEATGPSSVQAQSTAINSGKQR